MPDIDYNDLFGISGSDGAEDGASANEQDVVNPADDPGEIEGNEAVNESELDEPTDNDGNDAKTDPKEGAGEGKGDNTGEPGKRVQSPKERAGFAAARRAAEAKAAAELEAERARSKSEMDSFVKSLGLKDADGNAIETREAYERFNDGRRAAEARAALQRSGIGAEAIETLIAENPEVKAAKALVAEAEREKELAREAQRRVAFDEEIRKVGEIDPTVKTVKDMQGKPYFEAVCKMVENGYSIVDAVKLATYDERMARIADGSAKSAAAKAASKNHMVPTSGRAASAAPVPAEVARVYRKLYPGISDAEISKKYQKATN